MRKSSLVAFIVILFFLISSFVSALWSTYQPHETQAEDEPDGSITLVPSEPPLNNDPTPDVEDDREPEDPGETDIPEQPEVTPEPWPPPFEPYAVPGTEPDRLLSAYATMADGRITSDFNMTERIDFGFGEDYSQVEGITTFRGNNFRDTAAFGFADIREARFTNKWTRGSGSLTAPDGVTWTGHGWTGQPLIVRWPKDTRSIMNMQAWAKEKDDLVEVIYSAMDGYVYFAELETGRETRARLYIGYTFKGSGAIDPRGYPLLYVGAGYESSRGAARIFVISLVDGSVLLTFGNNDGFALRRWWAADSAPLIDSENDNLIYPSENGVLYIIKLNSVFDLESGTMTIAPSAPVKWRYNGIRSHKSGKFWLGYESSPVIWRGHLIIADNGGHLICLDLNTLEPVWVQDVLDDTNCSPVLELENGHPYIYISTSFHGGWRAPSNSSAEVPVWKIDAVTGEIVWKTDYICQTVSDVSGGVQGTIALGRYDLENLAFVPVARTPTRGAGILAALDKNTGEVVWEFQSRHYSWSSPVCVYDSDGKGYIVYPTSAGLMYLLDGQTGEMLDSIQLGGTTEASPAVFGNIIVIGTRSNSFRGIELR